MKVNFNIKLAMKLLVDFIMMRAGGSSWYDPAGSPQNLSTLSSPFLHPELSLVSRMVSGLTIRVVVDAGDMPKSPGEIPRL